MTTATSKIRPPLNGVDTPTLFATLDAVKGSPQLAKFQFRHRQRRGGPGGTGQRVGARGRRDHLTGVDANPHREQLIDVLWPELDPAAGPRRLTASSFTRAAAPLRRDASSATGRPAISVRKPPSTEMCSTPATLRFCHHKFRIIDADPTRSTLNVRS